MLCHNEYDSAFDSYPGMAPAKVSALMHDHRRYDNKNPLPVGVPFIPCWVTMCRRQAIVVAIAIAIAAY